jgi:hypothetical protein
VSVRAAGGSFDSCYALSFLSKLFSLSPNALRMRLLLLLDETIHLATAKMTNPLNKKNRAPAVSFTSIIS